MKKIIRFLSLVILSLAFALFAGFFVFLSNVSADQIQTSIYKAQIENCLKKRNLGQAKSIADYICPEGAMLDQDAAYQVVLDLEFRKIDKEIKAELQAFQKDKTKNALDVRKKLSDWFEQTSPDGGKYPKKYEKICHDLASDGNPLFETVKAFSGSASVTTDGATAMFTASDSACTSLIERKIDAYQDMGELIGTKNIMKTYTDDKDMYTDTLKGEYEKFMMEWTIYIGELARIKSKWTQKTKIQN